MEHLILSARAWWCEPGEPIAWAFPDPFRVPLFEVPGLDEHGRKKRNLATRAAFQLGAAPFRVAALLSFGEEPADDRRRPSAAVSARSVDSIAVRMAGTGGEAVPGAAPGILVATPRRLALLEVAGSTGGAASWLDRSPWLQRAKKVGGAAYEFADDFAGTMISTSNHKGRSFDHGDQTQVPRVVERACITTDQIAGYEITRRTFHRPGYDKDNREGAYLRITFADASRLDLELPANTTPDRVLGLVHGRSRW